MKSRRSNPGPEARAAAFHLSATWQQATVPNTAVPGGMVFWRHQVELASDSVSQEDQPWVSIQSGGLPSHLSCAAISI